MERKRTNPFWSFVVPTVLLVFFAISGKKLLGEDYAIFLTWWLLIFAIGLSFLPLASLFFSAFHDRGWLFAKVLGIAGAGWLMWLLSSMKLLRFTQKNAFLVLLLCFVCNLLLYVLLRKKRVAEQTGTDYTAVLGAVYHEEIIFFVFFLLWSYLRGCKPEAYGTEKFMDYGFMTVMLRCDYMPPEDLWMSGNSINYYYVGQYLASFLSKLTGAGAEYGYNLMMMTLSALGFALPYSLVYNLTHTLFSENARYADRSGKLAAAAGAISGVMVSMTSTLHYTIYGLVVPIVRNILGLENKNYWFPDATRYIGYNPETNDKTIHEFPAYSFVLGDLHAHVINTIFVLTVTALLFGFLQTRRKQTDLLRAGEGIAGPNFLKEVFQPVVIAVGFFIGLFHMTNFWDFPIYFVVAGAVILFSNAVLYQFSKRTLWLTAAHAAVVLVLAKLVCLPFTLSFDQISTGIRLTVNRTPLYQLMILWGLPITVVIVFLLVLIRGMKEKRSLSASKTRKKPAQSKKQARTKAGAVEKASMAAKDEAETGASGEGILQRLNGAVAYQTKKNGLFQLIEYPSITDLFVLTIGLCAIGLILLPEVIYVKDIYEGDYKRANTMFKLTYQAFILFGMAVPYILMRFFVLRETKLRRNLAVVCMLLLVTTVGYFGNATKAWFGDYSKPEAYKGLDASAFMEKESYDDYLATNWLNENVTGIPVVLEMNGVSYSFHQRVSVITGLPTVLGWRTHEWLWRSGADSSYPEEVTERQNDVLAIYTGTDEAQVRALIEKYDISYIYVGEGELIDGYSGGAVSDTNTYYYHGMYYQPIETNHELLRSLGEVVFELPADETKAYATYIVKLDR